MNAQRRPQFPREQCQFLREPVPRPVKHMKYACRAMTICIAAKCSAAGEPRIVLFCDTRLSLEWSSSDEGRKTRSLGRNWFALLSGSSWEKAVRLSDAYRDYITATPILDECADEQLKEPFRR